MNPQSGLPHLNIRIWNDLQDYAVSFADMKAFTEQRDKIYQLPYLIRVQLVKPNGHLILQAQFIRVLLLSAKKEKSWAPFTHTSLIMNHLLPNGKTETSLPLRLVKIVR